LSKTKKYIMNTPKYKSAARVNSKLTPKQVRGKNSQPEMDRLKRITLMTNIVVNLMNQLVLAKKLTGKRDMVTYRLTIKKLRELASEVKSGTC